MQVLRVRLEITERLFNNRSEFKLTYLRALKELEAKIADSSVSAKVYFVSKFSFKNFDFQKYFFQFQKSELFQLCISTWNT